MKIRIQPEVTTRIMKPDGTIKEEHTEQGRAKILEINVVDEKPAPKKRGKKHGIGN